MARLAFDLGFENMRIQEIMGPERRNPGVETVENLLKQFRPPQLYDWDDHLFRTLAQYMTDQIERATTRRLRRQGPSFTTDLDPLPKALRCNRASDQSYMKDREYYFANFIRDFDPIPRAHLTSLSMQRDIFICFLGDVSFPGNAPRGTESDGTPGGANGEDYDADISHHSDDRGGSLSGEKASSQGESGQEDRSGRQSYEQDGAVASDPSVTGGSDDIMTGARDLIAEEALFDNVPAADGFESTGADMNMFHPIPEGRIPSELVTFFLSQSLLVMYVWDTRVYIKFFNDAKNRNIFEQVACSLADKGHCFLIFEDERVIVKQVPELWKATQQARLVLAGPKLDPQSTSGLSLQSCTKEMVLSQIDRCGRSGT